LRSDKCSTDLFGAPQASARTGPTSPFTGEYDDPNHPGCERSVKVSPRSLQQDVTACCAVVLRVLFGAGAHTTLRLALGEQVTGQTLGPDGRRRREPQVIIRGTDSSTGTCTPGDAEVKPWRLTGYVTEKGDKMFVDFSPKGGPKDLVATYEGGIKFPDGNTWTRKEPVAAK
jgi:hypothetical protein